MIGKIVDGPPCLDQLGWTLYLMQRWPFEYETINCYGTSADPPTR